MALQMENIRLRTYHRKRDTQKNDSRVRPRAPAEVGGAKMRFFNAGIGCEVPTLCVDP